jgi:hypothetical protein
MAKASQASNAPVQKVVTRARSEKTIASLDRVKDRAALEEYLKNSNKHLVARATFKLAEPADRAGMTAEKNAKKTAA